MPTLLDISLLKLLIFPSKTSLRKLLILSIPKLKDSSFFLEIWLVEVLLEPVHCVLSILLISLEPDLPLIWAAENKDNSTDLSIVLSKSSNLMEFKDYIKGLVSV